MSRPFAEISDATAPIRNGALFTPYPGRWLPPERHEDGAVTIATEPGLTRLVVTSTGTVVLQDGSHTSVLSSSLSSFLACARAYTDALRQLTAVEPDDEAALAALETELLSRIKDLDPEHEAFWAGAAEEIGTGTAPASVAAPVAAPFLEAGAAPGRILLALSDEERRRWFTAEEWKQLGSLAPVTTVRAAQAIRNAMAVAEQLAAARGLPVARPSVLVVPGGTDLDEATLAALPEVRLIVGLGTGVTRPADGPAITVVTLGQEATGADVLAAIRQFHA